MKSLLKNNNALMNPIISCILSLAVVVIMYNMFMPMLSFIALTLVNMGAPAETTLLYIKYARWGFYLFAAGALIILLATVWRRTHDTGLRSY